MSRANGFVLIHGGLHGAWCWERLIPLLDRPALAVDLPGRDRSAPGFADITYADWVESAFAQTRGFDHAPIVLVSHSLGGITMPAVAARMAESVAALVFISALIPREGMTALDTLKEIGVNRIAYREKGEGEIPRDRIKWQLYNDMSEADAELALARLVPEPPKPFLAPITRADLPDVPIVYIRPTQDRAFTQPMQEHLIRNLGRSTREVFIDASHTVMFSQPQTVANVLNAL